eukprot:jgi/Mesen1/10512/ME000083S10013
MNDLYTLLQDLGERISCNTQEDSGETQLEEDETVVVSVRNVLPKLFERCFHPSDVNEKEVVAVLKLLTQAVTRYPGVLYDGEGSSVMPIIGRILPLFAEPRLSCELFEALTAVAKLLKSGDPVCFEALLAGAALLLEDLVSVASFFSTSSAFTDSTSISIYGLLEAFNVSDKSSHKTPATSQQDNVDAPTVPDSWHPPRGSGVLIDVTGNIRWQPLAVWIVKFIGWCISDRPRSIQGILTSTTLTALKELVYYGNSTLQKACFEAISVSVKELDGSSIQTEDLLQVLLNILAVSRQQMPLPSYRSTSYDAALGNCLSALYASASKGAVVFSAESLVELFPHAVTGSQSRDLKIALCDAFTKSLRLCPNLVEEVPKLLPLIGLSEIRNSISDCFELIVDTSPFCKAYPTKTKDSLHLVATEVVPLEKKSITGSPRPATGQADENNHEDQRPRPKKRQKVQQGDEAATLGGEHEHLEVPKTCQPTDCLNGGTIVDVEMDGVEESEGTSLSFSGHPSAVHLDIFKYIRDMYPNDSNSQQQNEEALRGLRVFAKVFSKRLSSSCGQQLVECLGHWIVRASQQIQDGLLPNTVMVLLIEAMEKLLAFPGHDNLTIAWNIVELPEIRRSVSSWSKDATAQLLLHPWSSSGRRRTGQTVDSLFRTKARAVGIAVCLERLGVVDQAEDIVSKALGDPHSRVKATAISMIPILGASWSFEKLLEYSNTVRTMADDSNEELFQAVAGCAGHMACLAAAKKHSPSTESGAEDGMHKGHHFFCPRCDRMETTFGQQTCTATALSEHPSELQQEEQLAEGIPLTVWQPLFLVVLTRPQQLLTSHKAFISSLPRLLAHATEDGLASTKAEWLRCLEILPVHPDKAVRQAFSDILGGFASKEVLRVLFDLDGGASARVGSDDLARALVLLSILRRHLSSAQEAEFLATLMTAVVNVALFATRELQQLVFFCLVLLIEQLDSADMAVRVAAASYISSLANRCPIVSSVALPLRMSALVEVFKDQLFDYFADRLLARPSLVLEFTEAVLGIQCSAFLKEMVPKVFPRLVLEAATAAQDGPDKTDSHQGKELPHLLVDWCHKVLVVVLLRGEGKDLKAVLEFYETCTGYNPEVLFQAVLPHLLVELVRYLGDHQSEAAVHRASLVAPMLKEVASIVTGSHDLPEFLRQHFLYLLKSVDHTLLRSGKPELQGQGLRCIDCLVDLIGPHLSPFVPKILALLTRSLEDSVLWGPCLASWLCLVTKLAGVAPATLKSVASQIVVAVMPCLDVPLGQASGVTRALLQPERPHQEGVHAEEGSHLGAAVEVLMELIVKNGDILEEQLQELPLLPSLPTLVHVNEVLLEVRGEMTVQQQLCRAADGLAHESLSVRYMAAAELKKVIKGRHPEVSTMVMGDSASAAGAVSNLVAMLLKGCAEESRTALSQRLKLVCAECLGELGGIDPAKLQVELPWRSRMQRSDEALVVELIAEHLAKVLRAATDTDVQDSAALAIQEILKLFGCRPSLLEAAPAVNQPKKGNRKEAAAAAASPDRKQADEADMSAAAESLWSCFSDDVKDIIAPCLTSKFVMLRRSASSAPAGPIIKQGMSHRRWMYLWSKHLTDQSNGLRADIFAACKGIVHHDVGTAVYLLPYLVLNVVCEGTDAARAGVIQEIVAVLAEDRLGSQDSNTKEDKPGGTAAASGRSTAARPSEISTQTIFTLLDSLGRWLEDCKQALSLMRASKSQPASLLEEINQLAARGEHVASLLAAVPKQALAQASYRCHAFARALLYFESHVRATSGTLNPAAEKNGVFQDGDVTFLLEIYSGLDEPDGLAGLAQLRSSTSLEDEMLINEKSGNWAQALTCYEQALQMEPQSVSRHSDLLNCLLNMGHFQAMVTHVDGLLARMPEQTARWSTQGVQAAWRMGQWERLDEYVETAEKADSLQQQGHTGPGAFDRSLAKLLQELNKSDYGSFSEGLTQARQSLLAPLAAAGMESYVRAYPLVVKLHMLRELEDCMPAPTAAECSTGQRTRGPEGEEAKGTKDVLLQDWESRLKVTQPSLSTREPILALRRLVYGMKGLQSEVGACWLQYAKMCREAGHYQTANRAILEARFHGAANAHIESAKLLWDTKHAHQAVAELQDVLQLSPHALGEALPVALGGQLRSHGLLPQQLAVTAAAAATGHSELASSEHAGPEGPGPSLLGPAQAQAIARTLLQLARWVHHTGQKQKAEVIALYNQVKVLQPKWEKSYFFLAKYCDDLLVDARRRQEESQDVSAEVASASLRAAQRSRLTVAGSKVIRDDKAWWTYCTGAMSNYAKTLHHGHRRLFQALPRLLTLWFEFGSRFYGDKLNKPGLKDENKKVIAIMKTCLKALPTYQWLTAMPQLVSRICHQNEEVVKLLKDIIHKVLKTHPQQAMWSMAAVSKSTLAARREAAADIINRARNDTHNERERGLFLQFAAFFEQMIALCNHNSGGQSKARTLSIGAEFGRLKRMMPLGILMPVQKALSVALPTDGLTDPCYDPFPAGDCTTVVGIQDEVEILASLQKPKKVVLLGSDGREYPFLCKPKDDLRKDARMMEFVAMLNRLLSKDASSRRRKLYIRSFAVLPLTEDCGMIEWVPHTRGLRHILQDVYSAAGKFDRLRTNPMIKKIYDQHQGLGEEAFMLRTRILPMFPPMFHVWFLNTFPEPAAWFRARVAFAHTTAVWSMVGHIVGLGDRHGENILFDSTTGDCVHVDFSCLFDKGLALEKPELVPFRLTQNMVDGLGITGYEGVFRRVCEITLSVLRGHRETLMSVLETFIHDPLVEWTKSHKSSGGEMQNPHAQRALGNIEARLQGVVVGVGAAPSLPLSVEGQAHRLIAEAVAHENLGRMYIWWMSWF